MDAYLGRQTSSQFWITVSNPHTWKKVIHLPVPVPLSSLFNINKELSDLSWNKDASQMSIPAEEAEHSTKLQTHSSIYGSNIQSVGRLTASKLAMLESMANIGKSYAVQSSCHNTSQYQIAWTKCIHQNMDGKQGFTLVSLHGVCSWSCFIC